MKRILVIEDDPMVQTMLRQTLERAGFEVVTADNGNAGIRQYRRRPFDVVVTDLIMPDKEGIETICDLKREDPKATIIAMSGGGRNRPEDYLHLAAKLGAQRTFTKPIDRDALLSAVDELIQPAA